MQRIQHPGCSAPPGRLANSFGAYIVIHKIHLMNLKNAATLVPVRRAETARAWKLCVQIELIQEGRGSSLAAILTWKAVSRFKRRRQDGGLRPGLVGNSDKA